MDLLPIIIIIKTISIDYDAILPFTNRVTNLFSFVRSNRYQLDIGLPFPDREETKKRGTADSAKAAIHKTENLSIETVIRPRTKKQTKQEATQRNASEPTFGVTDTRLSDARYQTNRTTFGEPKPARKLKFRDTRS